MDTSSKSPAWFQRALEAPSEQRSVNVDGTHINYVAWGKIGNPGIVLVHGSNAHLEWWRFVAPFLADQFRVAALDSSGNGDSGWREKYTGQVFAKEVKAVCDDAELGTTPFVVGHSFGGFVTLEAGHHYGDELGGIIMMDFSVQPAEKYIEWGMRAEREGVKEKRKTRRYPDFATALGRFRLLPEQPCQHPHIIDHIARHSIHEVEDGWTWKFDPTLFDHLEMGLDQSDKFINLKCRSALVMGENSDDEGAHGAPYMAEITRGVLPSFIIPGTYHHLMFDEPLAVVTAIKGIILSWVREDRADEMTTALQDALQGVK